MTNQAPLWEHPQRTTKVQSEHPHRDIQPSLTDNFAQVFDPNGLIEATKEISDDDGAQRRPPRSVFCGQSRPALVLPVCLWHVSVASIGLACGVRVQMDDASAADSSVGKPCLVCGANSYSTHFGAQSCRACSAFFRRTVSHNIRYVCLRSSACNVTKSEFAQIRLSELPSFCRACRLKKCFKVGMQKSGESVTTKF